MVKDTNTLLQDHIQLERSGTGRFFQNIIFHIHMGYFIAFLKYFTEGRVKNAHFSIFDPFSPGPTGIKGATGQMLP